MHWKVFLASATGKYHLDAAEPCQDAAHFAIRDEAFVGVVCDGAGSAEQGQAGAQFLARAVTEGVAGALASGCLTHSGGPGTVEQLQDIVRGARDALSRIAASEQRVLRDFASTLVGCFSTPLGGCFFHIGDGFAVQRAGAGAAAGSGAISLPENGEFADQTYFVTDESWCEHLRVTPLGAVHPGCVIGLMSDGTASFAIDRARTGFFGPFIDPVVTFLRKTGGDDGSLALQNLLEGEKTFAITGDDKTLLLALAA